MQFTITNLTCNNSSSKVDKVFLYIQPDGLAPTRYPVAGFQVLGPGESMTLPEGGLTIDYDYGVNVWVNDEDFLSSDDFLVNFSNLNPNGSMYNHNGAHYTWSAN